MSWNVLIKDLIFLITFIAHKFKRRKKTNSNLLHVLIVFARVRVRLNKNGTFPVLFVLSKFPSCHLDDKMLPFYRTYRRNYLFPLHKLLQFKYWLFSSNLHNEWPHLLANAPRSKFGPFGMSLSNNITDFQF